MIAFMGTDAKQSWSSGHIVYQPNVDSETLRLTIDKQLREQFHINHITLQMESEDKQHLKIIIIRYLGSGSLVLKEPEQCSVK